MKILFITDGLYPFVLGGMQKHASYILKNFANSEHHVTVITTAPQTVSPETAGSELFEGPLPTNIDFHYIPFPALPSFPGHYVLASYLYARRVGKTWAQRLEDFDVIYAKGFTSWHILSIKDRFSTPVVVQLHGLEMFQKPQSFKDKLAKLILQFPARKIIKKADYIFSYGGKVRDLLIQLGKSPDRVLEQYGAVDDFWIDPPPAIPETSASRFLFVARYEFRKGYHVLKPVLEKMIAENLQFEVDFVGEIPLALQIKNNNIHYHGNQRAEDIKKLMDRCGFILLPSLAEGFPTILVEAMARGLAPIASDVGAVSAVVNNANGWLIPPADKDALGGAMKEARGMNAQTLNEKREASRELVLSEFNWKSMHKALVSHLLFIIHDHRQRLTRQESLRNKSQ